MASHVIVTLALAALARLLSADIICLLSFLEYKVPPQSFGIATFPAEQ
jgi:hypothetical protein